MPPISFPFNITGSLLSLAKPLSDYGYKAIASFTEAANSYTDRVRHPYILLEEKSKNQSIELTEQNAQNTAYINSTYGKARSPSTIKEDAITTVAAFEALLNEQHKGHNERGTGIPPLIVEKFREAICSPLFEDLKDFLRSLSPEKLDLLTSSLVIKSHFTIEEADSLIKQFEDAKGTFRILSEKNNFSNYWILVKNFWLTEKEKIELEDKIRNANLLINTFLAKSIAFKHIILALEENNTENLDKLIQDHFIFCCELAKFSEDFTKFEELIEIPTLQKPRLIEILDSVILYKCLVSAPAFASGVLSGLIYIGIVIFSAAQAALLATFASIFAVILRVSASTAVWLYEHREKQKTKGWHSIKTKVSHLNSVLKRQIIVDTSAIMQNRLEKNELLTKENEARLKVTETKIENLENTIKELLQTLQQMPKPTAASIPALTAIN